jgi:hypothetical protein
LPEWGRAAYYRLRNGARLALLFSPVGPMEKAMFDQIFDTVRKSSESSLQMQQDLMKYWSQQWSTPQAGAGATSPDWGRSFQKRWVELALEILNRHRESLDATYKVAIQVLEQSAHVSDAKSTEEYRRLVEDVSRKLFETLKEQSETQFGDLQKWTARSFEMMQKAAE